MGFWSVCASIFTLRYFDLWGYRKNKAKTIQYTAIGGIISLIVFALLCLMVYHDYYAAKTPYNTSQLTVNAMPHTKLILNIDMVLPKLSCDLVSVHVQQATPGSAEYSNIEFQGHLYKRYVDYHGKQTKEQKVHKTMGTRGYYHTQHIPIAELKKLLTAEESCHIHGHLQFHGKSGRLAITGHSVHLAKLAKHSEENYTLDFSHTLNHLSFGPKNEVNELSKNDPESFTPLDGTQHISAFPYSKHNNSFGYRLQLVPTSYKKEIGWKTKVSQVHQMTGESFELAPNPKPGVFIDFESSTLEIQYNETRDSVWMAMIMVLVYLGGICMCAKQINVFINSQRKSFKVADDF